MIVTAWVLTHHFVILHVVSVALHAVLAVREAEAESDVVLGGQPLVLGAHHQPREAKLAHDNVSWDNNNVRLSPMVTGY